MIFLLGGRTGTRAQTLLHSVKVSVHREAQKSSTSGFHSCISGCGRKLQLWTLSVDKNSREKAMRRNQKYSVVGPGPNGPSLQVLAVLGHDWG